MAKKQNTPLRAVAYLRTSGEGQRDNTSIPRQKKDAEALNQQEGWTFIRHYVDECKTGSTVEGRHEFQRMIRDAANDEFDIVIVFDISRFARDGSDIIENAKLLKKNFGIGVVDTKGNFDSRDHQKAFTNFVHAGFSEKERLDIKGRTQPGRIARAREGKPWSSQPPIGRAYDKVEKRWYITDKGKAIAEVLRRYVEGENLKALCSELGIPRAAKISEWVWHGQLSGTYVARFHCKDIDIDEEVPVPGIPQVITAALLKKAQARLRHNRTYNRHDVRSYVLTGFIRCGDCGKALSGQASHGEVYYRHKGTDGCTIKGVRGDQVESAILDHLYTTFLDEPAFNAAVQRAMPSRAHREGLVEERGQAEKRLAKNDREIRRLVDAIAGGADVGLLLSKQDELKVEKSKLAKRLQELETEITTLPSAEHMEAAAMLTRIRLMEDHRGKDWRQFPYEDVKRFLFHLFGETKPGTGTGVFLTRDGQGRLIATFKGQMDFLHRIVDGQPISKAMEVAVAGCNAAIAREYEAAVQAADLEYRRDTQALKPPPGDCSPGAPTDPDVQDYRIRFLR